MLSIELLLSRLVGGFLSLHLLLMHLVLLLLSRLVGLLDLQLPFLDLLLLQLLPLLILLCPQVFKLLLVLLIELLLLLFDLLLLLLELRVVVRRTGRIVGARRRRTVVIAPLTSGARIVVRGAYLRFAGVAGIVSTVARFVHSRGRRRIAGIVGIVYSIAGIVGYIARFVACVRLTVIDRPGFVTAARLRRAAGVSTLCKRSKATVGLV